jgi:alpha/beta superfamily hydrolase
MEALAKLITRPRRERYDLTKLRPNLFKVNGLVFERESLRIQGKRGEIVASLYDEQKSKSKKCIVYCHGNSGCQLDCEEILDVALVSGFCVLGFDFSGCGNSEGDVVSLGFFEKDDIESVVQFLYSRTPDIKIVLWGRSMGAVSCIFYVYCNPHIYGLILDSPFCDFSVAADKIISDYKILPKFLRKLLFNSTSEYIQKHHNFNIKSLKPGDFIKNCKIPSIFIHSVEDSLIEISSSRQLYSLVKGPKSLLEITGNHGGLRSKFLIIKALRVLELLLTSNKKNRKIKETSRDDPPQLNPTVVEFIRHRRGFSQGVNN